MARHSIVFAQPGACAGDVQIRITHVEARRLIDHYELAKRGTEDSESDEIGSWEKRPAGNYYIHLHT